MKEHSIFKTYFFFLYAGSGAVNFIIDHAEVDFVFVQDKKVKEVGNKDHFHLLEINN